MSSLVLEDIRHSFGRGPVLNGVTVSVAAGEVACLLGPSGCGKTTLLRLAAGLETLQQGRIVIAGQMVAEADRPQLPPERRGVGLMFQDYALFPHLTVIENVTFGLDGRTTARRAWIDAALERMGLEGYAGRYPHELSGGQQQRVALLRALAPEPAVLLLDEPFSGLDVTRRAQVREQTLQLLKDVGLTTLMVTHDPEEAMYMSDNLLVMNQGRIVQAGPPLDVYFNPRNAFVADLFGQVNRLSGTVGDDAMVETVFGRFAVPGVATGTRVHILIRPEGVNAQEAPDGGGETASVLAARPIGRSTHLRVIGSDQTTVLQARIPGVFMPPSGAPVSLTFDENQVFVFPADEA